MIRSPKNLVVISPHPDDETLGGGGTIAKFAARGTNVSVLVVSGHLPPLYNQEDFDVTEKEAKKAFASLGVHSWKFLKLPATMVHTYPTAKLNKQIYDFISNINPEIVLIPFPDRHIDHRTIFDSALVCCRPIKPRSPKIILAYETLSETHWNAPGVEPSFTPELYVNIDKTIDIKLNALKHYKSQLKNNNSRSIQATKALALFRGSQNGCSYAEAFKVIRMII